MKPPARHLLATLAALLLFAALAIPAQHLDYLIRNWIFLLAEFAGISDLNSPLWGQIRGHNIHRKPEWMHTLARWTGPALALLPVLATSLYTYAFIVARAPFPGTKARTHPTRCGGCGRVLRNLTEPRCPHPGCGRSL